MLLCNVGNLPSQGIDMFIYWRQMVPVCPPPRSSSTSKWPAKEFPSKVCRSVWPSPKARRDVHQIRAAFSDNKGIWKVWGERERLLLPVQNSSGPIYTDPLPNAGKKKKACHLSEMKKHGGSGRDNEWVIHCGSVWSCQCWELWKQGTEDCGSWNYRYGICYKIHFNAVTCRLSHNLSDRVKMCHFILFYFWFEKCFNLFTRKYLVLTSSIMTV